jgi:hypothetical protein
MEFILQGKHGETITVKDDGKNDYLLVLQCSRSSAVHKIVITKDQFKRLAKAS